MRHRFLCLLVAVFFAIPAPVLAKQFQRGLSVVSDASPWGKYHALIIGINDYKEWPRLRTAVKDATVIRDTLVARYGFDEKNVILRTDKSASRVQINRDLRYLAKSMQKDDNLFIYYAGHGQLDDFTGDGYWVPAEGALKDPSSWVSNSYIKAVLSSEKLQAKNVVVIADSCYSGSMLRGGPSLMSLDDRQYREKLVAKASFRSRQVISSGGVEPVADGGAEGHSLFAYYLIDALRKNDREVIDLENLFHTKVWRPVTEIGNQRPNVGRLKTPMDHDGQFVLYNVALARSQQKSRQSVSGKIEKATTAGPMARSAPRTINAEEETWEIVKASTNIEDYTFFLEAYPDSRFRTAAMLKIQQLKRKQRAQNMTASVAPAVVKPGIAEPVAESAASNAAVVDSEANYIKYASGIIYDKKTNLEWYVGPDEDTNRYEAGKWVKSLDVGGGGWQLPKIQALRTLYNKEYGRHKIHSFFKTKGAYVWIDHMEHSTWLQKTFSFEFGQEVGFYANNSSNIRAFAVRTRKDPSPAKSDSEKPNALYASIAPAVAEQPISTSRETAQDTYKLALLPSKVLDDWSNLDKMHNAVIQAVAEASDNDKKFILELSYRRAEGLFDHVKLLPEKVKLEADQIWKKETAFSNYAPEWNQIKKIAGNIDADLGLLVFAHRSLSGVIDIYLYDFRNDKVYKRKQVGQLTNDASGAIRIEVAQVLKDFLHQQ